ncbi:Response regulator c-di-GMP phosphodiesterase, RpfG family, contains REC and HD-GYP domains [Desulfuromusa kysingii]|uniref:Response regulator c-di-GMP phosphodiesterase, RpfG family, contains REC and HD-GYP domains n=1 Tax=Desulfuromusa kysingii TaxID=37625 RepID=A0A1H4AF44_9BACT|nr:HD domain-containing phosphohydrolase [Desulfuromusa kysingii]SEA34615.1 Response regulator c-di-GMP phosphodiesterase, RpfG family, contains REC and HD-GYP domains [Desulfuromusa kysingii]
MSEKKAPEKMIKILLVDDEVNIAKALRRLLMDADLYEIYIANSGADALTLLTKHSDIGVIISDQRMPEMTGVEFLQKARDIVPEAIRILLTGYADIEASIAAINKGAVFRYLSKPWDDNSILQAVAEAARNFWLVAENRRLNALVLKQKDELQEWNQRLKQRVLDQTATIRARGDELSISNKLLKKSFDETIKTLAGLFELRDSRASGHSRNVAELVRAMAGKLGLPEEEKNQICSAGLLHDIGKIGISDKVLVKLPQELDSQERQEYQTHVIRGQTAIDMVPTLREVSVLIRHHHERYDGKGFPDKLKGDAIPLGARIICAVDMFERKLNQFPECDALSSALNSLEMEWGTSLDPTMRAALEESAQEVYTYLDLSSEVIEIKIAPKDLKPGMQLRRDLHSGTGVLLLKQGIIFDENSIDAVKRCFMIDPFEREICVMIKRDELNVFCESV